MSQTAKRAIQISDGLVSMAQKRMKNLIAELQKEGVLTKSESQVAMKRLGQAKSAVYDKMKKEFQKVVAMAGKSPKRKRK